MDLEHGGGDDTEVVASAAEAPEQRGMRGIGDSDGFGICSHETRRYEIVGHQAVAALEPAVAAAEGGSDKADTIARASSYGCWLKFLREEGGGNLRVSLPAERRASFTLPIFTPPPMVIVLVAESTAIAESGVMSTMMASRTSLSETPQPWRPLPTSKLWLFCFAYAI